MIPRRYEYSEVKVRIGKGLYRAIRGIITEREYYLDGKCNRRIKEYRHRMYSDTGYRGKGTNVEVVDNGEIVRCYVADSDIRGTVLVEY